MKLSPWLLAAVLVPVLYFGLLRLNLSPMTENCNDVYWHIAAADRPLSAIFAKHFPITNSVWRDHYADKELVFHLLLKGYTSLKHLFHSPLTPPFHLPVLFFDLLFFAAFVHVCRVLKLKEPLIFFVTLALAAAASSFSVRLMMLRPHLFSMTLMLLVYSVLLRGPAEKKTAWKIFGLSFLYAWSYSSPHIVWAMTFVFSLVCFRRDGWKSFRSFLAAVAGVLAGYTVHPQFPNTFLVWKIQGWDALLAPVRESRMMIPYATELLPPGAALLVRAIPAFFLLYVTLMIFIRSYEKKLPPPPEIAALCLLAFFWTCGMFFLSARPVEYAVPLILLSAGVLFQYAGEKELFRFCCSGKNVLLFFGVFILLVSTVTWMDLSRRYAKEVKLVPYDLFCQARKVIPPGSRIINIVWSDFPSCMLAAPEYEYTWGLDPMFSCVPFPEKSNYLGQISFLKRPVSAERTGALFQADYAIVLAKNYMIADFLTRCGWVTAFHTSEGWIFRLRTKQKGISLP